MTIVNPYLDDNTPADTTPPPAQQAPAIDPAMVEQMVAAQVARLQERLTINAGSAPKRVDQVTTALQARGFDINSVAAAAEIAKAMVEDQLEDVKKEQNKQALEKLQAVTLAKIDSEISQHASEVPALKWAKDEIKNRALHMMANSPEFANTRALYNQGQMPKDEEFNKAVGLVVAEYCKDHGILKNDNPSQLDTKSSKPKTANNAKSDGPPPAIHKTAYEMYYLVLNETKDPAMAATAAQRFIGLDN